MKDILLYVDVFEVVRYCCTREWMQKYVMSTFLAVEKHLHRPCFASIDSKVRRNWIINRCCLREIHPCVYIFIKLTGLIN